MRFFAVPAVNFFDEAYIVPHAYSHVCVLLACELLRIVRKRKTSSPTL